MRRVAAALVVASGLAALPAWGCHTARMIAPPPPLRAASVAPFAVEVEFAEALDKTSAEDAAHYSLYPAGNPGAPAAIASATVVDTVYGRAVQLVVPGWLGASPDSAGFEVATSGVMATDGVSTGSRRTRFRTGLNYTQPLADLFAVHCNSCHGSKQSSGSYRTDSFAALFGAGTSPTANLIPGDPRCLLAVKTKPRNSMFSQGGLSYLDSDIILNWIVNYSARP